jgi:putative restriction endonuclease
MSDLSDRIGYPELLANEAQNIPPGTNFADRRELAEAGLHRQRQAGIAWTLAEGAYSIVLSGGYEDDEDHGGVIIYTGEGGRDEKTGNQIADQQLVRGNLALAKSKHQNTLVNVIRGFNHKSSYSPKTGYRYAGKYVVTEYWEKTGKSGFKIYRYRLEALDVVQTATQAEMPKLELPATERRTYTAQRVVRDTKQALVIKQTYDYACQVCEIAIQLPLGTKYAEGAHIRPLGRPHDGPDHISNLLCLCPNHHVMFDNYVYSVEPGTHRLIGGLEGTLKILPGHHIDPEHFAYHNKLFGLKNQT